MSTRIATPLFALSTLALLPWLSTDGADPAPPTGWQDGAVAFESLGALAVGPDGVLFAADHRAASVVALRFGLPKKAKALEALDVPHLDEVLSYLLDTTRDDLTVHDLAYDAEAAAAYLSVTRGGGNDARHVLVAIRGPEDFEVLDLEDVAHQSTSFDDVPGAPQPGQRDRRALAITDLEFHDGVLYVAGLSNEEFASKLRAFDFPFAAEDAREANVEVYHGAHGEWETRAPVRTMTTLQLGGEDTLLCGYTCTPLVKVPVSAIDAAAEGEDGKYVGTTVAELGAGNVPLDMIEYERDGAGHVLIANSRRGVMKLATAGLSTAEGLDEPVRGTAGHPYETVEELRGVTQLVGFDAEHALTLVEDEAGLHLRTIDLP